MSELMAGRGREYPGSEREVTWGRYVVAEENGVKEMFGEGYWW